MRWFQFVCFGGSPSRMQKFAEYMVEALNYKLPAGQGLTDIAQGSDRYVLYKVGPVLSVSVSEPICPSAKALALSPF